MWFMPPDEMRIVASAVRKIGPFKMPVAEDFFRTVDD
jgi:hypothetical protein